MFALNRAWSVFPDSAGQAGSYGGGELCLFSILPGKGKTQPSVSFFPEVRRISAKAEHKVCFEPELELAFRAQHLLVTLLAF